MDIKLNGLELSPKDVLALQRANEQYELNHSSKKRLAKEIVDEEDANKEAMRKLLTRKF